MLISILSIPCLYTEILLNKFTLQVQNMCISFLLIYFVENICRYMFIVALVYYTQISVKYQPFWEITDGLQRYCLKRIANINVQL